MPKAGTSSIQATLARNRKPLKRQGVIWPDAAHIRGCNFDTLAKAMAGRMSGRVIKQFGAFVARNPDRHVAISSEFLWSSSPAEIERLVRFLDTNRVRIVVYVRHYAAYLVSKYKQHARARRALPHFDRFYRREVARISLRPRLEAWLSAFDRSAFHVRHLTELPDGDVVADYLSVVDVMEWEPAIANPTPHWLTCELARAMFLGEKEKGQLYKQKAEFRSFCDEVDRAVVKQGFPAAQYLTVDQWDELDAAFRDDAAWLLEVLGVSPPAPERRPANERPFLPALQASPQAFFDLLRRKLRKSDILKNSPYIAATVADALARASAAAARR